MKEKKVHVSNIDPVDHEKKKISSSEDYIVDNTENEVRKDVSDTMLDPNKQVSAEISRDDVDERLNKGC